MNERTFDVEVQIKRVLRVTVGGEGSQRLKGETDEAAAEAIAADYFHLHDAALPPYVKLQEQDYEIEDIHEVMTAGR